MFAVDRERLVVTLIQKAKSTGRVEFLFSHEVSTIDCEGERMKINFVDKDDCVMVWMCYLPIVLYLLLCLKTKI